MSEPVDRPIFAEPVFADIMAAFAERANRGEIPNIDSDSPEAPDAPTDDCG